MRILLIYPRLGYPGYGELQEPLGLLYIASSLEHAGFHVELKDLTLAENHAVLDEPLRRADVVAMSSSTSLFGRALSTLEYVRRLTPDIPAIIGGPHATACPEDAIEKGFDYGVIGEGETTIVELLSALSKGSNPHDIPGLISKRSGKIIRAQGREFIADVDSIPLPARHLLDFKSYFNKGMIHIGMMISRGCPYRCSFCKPMQDMLFGKKTRSRGPASVVMEMKDAIKTIGERLFLFRDDTVGALPREWFEEFRDLRKIEGIDNIRWSCQMRVDQVDEETIQLMKECGCVGIAFGVESGSQKVLDYYRKSIAVEDTIKAFDICHEYGIGTHAFIMMGAPVEDRGDLEQTIRLVKRIRPESISVSITTPAPGTELYNSTKEMGLINDNGYDDADYLLNQEPMKLVHLTRDDLAWAHEEILNLVPKTFHLRHFHDQHLRWQERLRRPENVA